jgi:hypothetical protein
VTSENGRHHTVIPGFIAGSAPILQSAFQFTTTHQVGRMAKKATSLDLWRQRPSSPLQILVFATGSVALFCLLGTLLARITFFIGDVLIERLRTLKYPDISALLYAL